MGPPTTSECLFRISFHMVAKSFPESYGGKVLPRMASGSAYRKQVGSVVHHSSTLFNFLRPVANRCGRAKTALQRRRQSCEGAQAFLGHRWGLES